MIIPTYEANADRSRQLYLTYREQDHATPHFHDAMELVICVKGEFNALIGGDKIILHAGDIAVADSYDVHNIELLFTSLACDILTKSIIASALSVFGKNLGNVLL